MLFEKENILSTKDEMAYITLISTFCDKYGYSCSLSIEEGGLVHHQPLVPYQSSLFIQDPEISTSSSQHSLFSLSYHSITQFILDAIPSPLFITPDSARLTLSSPLNPHLHQQQKPFSRTERQQKRRMEMKTPLVGIHGDGAKNEISDERSLCSSILSDSNLLLKKDHSLLQNNNNHRNLLQPNPPSPPSPPLTSHLSKEFSLVVNSSLKDSPQGILKGLKGSSKKLLSSKRNKKMDEVDNNYPQIWTQDRRIKSRHGLSEKRRLNHKIAPALSNEEVVQSHISSIQSSPSPSSRRRLPLKNNNIDNQHQESDHFITSLPNTIESSLSSSLHTIPTVSTSTFEDGTPQRRRRSESSKILDKSNMKSSISLNSIHSSPPFKHLIDEEEEERDQGRRITQPTSPIVNFLPNYNVDLVRNIDSLSPRSIGREGGDDTHSKPYIPQSSVIYNKNEISLPSYQVPSCVNAKLYFNPELGSIPPVTQRPLHHHPTTDDKYQFDHHYYKQTSIHPSKLSYSLNMNPYGGGGSSTKNGDQDQEMDVNQNNNNKLDDQPKLISLFKEEDYTKEEIVRRRRFTSPTRKEFVECDEKSDNLNHSMIWVSTQRNVSTPATILSSYQNHHSTRNARRMEGFFDNVCPSQYVSKHFYTTNRVIPQVENENPSKIMFQPSVDIQNEEEDHSSHLQHQQQQLHQLPSASISHASDDEKSHPISFKGHNETNEEEEDPIGQLLREDDLSSFGPPPPSSLIPHQTAASICSSTTVDSLQCDPKTIEHSLPNSLTSSIIHNPTASSLPNSTSSSKSSLVHLQLPPQIVHTPPSINLQVSREIQSKMEFRRTKGVRKKSRIHASRFQPLI